MKIKWLIVGWLAINMWGGALAESALRDPTQPTDPALSVEKNGDLVVTMIMLGKGRALAHVSGKTVKVGDEINGVKVVKIEPALVIFRKADNTEFPVPLHFEVKKNIYLGENNESKK